MKTHRLRRLIPGVYTTKGKVYEVLYTKGSYFRYYRDNGVVSFIDVRHIGKGNAWEVVLNKNKIGGKLNAETKGDTAKA